MNPPPIEEQKVSWVPYPSDLTWDAFKKHMGTEKYKQIRHIPNGDKARIIYACKHNTNCKSEIEVHHHPTYYIASFNSIEHLPDCKQAISQASQISNMLLANAKPSKIAEVMKLPEDEKTIKALYNKRQALNKKDEVFIYDQAGLEKWALERFVDLENDDITNLDRNKVFVPDYEIGADFYFLMFTTVNLISQFGQFIDNLGYLGILIDGTYRLDHDDHVLFVLAVQTPDHQSKILAYSLAKSENNIVFSRLILKAIQIFHLTSNKKLKELYVVADLAPFVEKAMLEKLEPELEESGIDVYRLVCNVHFHGVKKRIVCKDNLSCDDQNSRDEAKKKINTYVKLMKHASSREVFDAIAAIFSKEIGEEHPVFYQKFERYLTEVRGWSLYKKKKLVPFDNNPLEGVNNGIKASITSYMRDNCGELLAKLEKQLDKLSKETLNIKRTMWMTRFRISTKMWKYAKCLENIFSSVFYKPPGRTSANVTLYIGEYYAFQTYLKKKEKTETSDEFVVGDKEVKINYDSTLEEIREFFKNDIFFKPERNDVELYNEPEGAVDLDDCYMLIKVKKVIVRGNIDVSSCSCSDFKIVGYCIHLIAALLHYGKIDRPPMLAEPGKYNLSQLSYFTRKRKKT